MSTDSPHGISKLLQHLVTGGAFSLKTIIIPKGSILDRVEGTTGNPGLPGKQPFCLYV